MIICPRCKTANDSERTTCHSCGANLLPGKKLSDRLGCLVGALVSGAVFVATAVLLIVGIQRSGVGGLLSSGCQMPAMIIGIGFLALAGLAYGLYESLRPVPDHEKYHTRASQQLEDNPEQALADFSRAIELAPERGRGPYLRDRAAALGKLGRTEEALADLTRAIELTPEAEHGGYLEQRASLYEQLGRTKEATADLRTYLDHVERTIPGTKGGQRANLLKVRAELLEKLGRYAEAAQQLEDYLQAPDAEVSEGASLLGNILPVDRDAFLDTFKADGVKSVEARIEKLRRDALATGELAAVGY
jgi:tetratricopeptide (TPR) repeat protein